MNSPHDKKPSQSRAVQICTLLFLVFGIAGFQVLAPSMFPPQRGGGFDVNRMLWAGIVAGACAGIGAGIGKLIDSLQGSKSKSTQSLPSSDDSEPLRVQSPGLENLGQDYLARIRAALSENGFLLSENLNFRQYEFALVASKIRFDFVGVPTYLEEFFLFCRCDGCDMASITDLCSAGWAYAAEHRKQRPWLARLLGVNLCSYTIVICHAVDPTVAEGIQSGTPPNHFGQGWEVPLAYDASNQKLHFYQKVPWLGGAFYTEMRKVIKKRLEKFCNDSSQGT